MEHNRRWRTFSSIIILAALLAPMADTAFADTTGQANGAVQKSLTRRDAKLDIAKGGALDRATTNVLVDAHGVCRWLDNNDAERDYFIPTSTAAEWQAFIDNAPKDVRVDRCCPATSVSLIASDGQSHAVPLGVGREGASGELGTQRLTRDFTLRRESDGAIWTETVEQTYTCQNGAWSASAAVRTGAAPAVVPVDNLTCSAIAGSTDDKLHPGAPIERIVTIASDSALRVVATAEDCSPAPARSEFKVQLIERTSSRVVGEWTSKPAAAPAGRSTRLRGDACAADEVNEAVSLAAGAYRLRISSDTKAYGPGLAGDFKLRHAITNECSSACPAGTTEVQFGGQWIDNDRRFPLTQSQLSQPSAPSNHVVEISYEDSGPMRASVNGTVSELKNVKSSGDTLTGTYTSDHLFFNAKVSRIGMSGDRVVTWQGRECVPAYGVTQIKSTCSGVDVSGHCRYPGANGSVSGVFDMTPIPAGARYLYLSGYNRAQGPVAFWIDTTKNTAPHFYRGGGKPHSNSFSFTAPKRLTASAWASGWGCGFDCGATFPSVMNVEYFNEGFCGSQTVTGTEAATGRAISIASGNMGNGQVKEVSGQITVGYRQQGRRRVAITQTCAMNMKCTDGKAAATSAPICK